MYVTIKLGDSQFDHRIVWRSVEMFGESLKIVRRKKRGDLRSLFGVPLNDSVMGRLDRQFDQRNSLTGKKFIKVDIY